MIELNNIRMLLGLSWNEFYLCYLVNEKAGSDGLCQLSRNDISENTGLSTRAIIDLVKKIEALGYLQNVSGKLKCSDKWRIALLEARDFSGSASEETSGEETSPITPKSEETSPAIHSIVKKLHHEDYTVGEETSLSRISEVKKLHHYTNDSEETSPANQVEVKKLHRQNTESIVYIPESEETSPEETSLGDLYILNNNINNISKGVSIEKEKGCGEKQKSKPFEITTDSNGVSTCQTLRQACLTYDATHPGLYTPEMYKAFIRHWSAIKAGKPAWYRELTRTKGTWDLPLRLSTWHQNDLKFNSKSTNGKSNQRSGGALRPTSIAEPSKRTGAGNVAHVEF
ncbi:hypothetical protein GCM10007423_39460 [Dyadobacter endophyticus]|uniref:Helix-turn-helix domain-containing protein n=1 Tax=Dyadobacter endophyticus TaxID=1749036 RepID=A0ABQ1YYL9_9BACT|nr:hypothetical protein [Dyadobacter endophyticus]GGH42670.1 hypothetical protein GCM10007423_39460 [Dyadobacter endophyticus]